MSQQTKASLEINNTSNRGVNDLYWDSYHDESVESEFLNGSLLSIENTSNEYIRNDTPRYLTEDVFESKKTIGDANEDCEIDMELTEEKLQSSNKKVDLDNLTLHKKHEYMSNVDQHYDSEDQIISLKEHTMQVDFLERQIQNKEDLIESLVKSLDEESCIMESYRVDVANLKSDNQRYINHINNLENDAVETMNLLSEKEKEIRTLRDVVESERELKEVINKKHHELQVTFLKEKDEQQQKIDVKSTRIQQLIKELKKYKNNKPNDSTSSDHDISIQSNDDESPFTFYSDVTSIEEGEEGIIKTPMDQNNTMDSEFERITKENNELIQNIIELVNENDSLKADMNKLKDEVEMVLLKQEEEYDWIKKEYESSLETNVMKDALILQLEEDLLSLKHNQGVEMTHQENQNHESLMKELNDDHIDHTSEDIVNSIVENRYQINNQNHELHESLMKELNDEQIDHTSEDDIVNSKIQNRYQINNQNNQLHESLMKEMNDDETDYISDDNIVIIANNNMIHHADDKSHQEKKKLLEEEKEGSENQLKQIKDQHEISINKRDEEIFNLKCELTEIKTSNDQLKLEIHDKTMEIKKLSHAASVDNKTTTRNGRLSNGIRDLSKNINKLLMNLDEKKENPQGMDEYEEKSQENHIANNDQKVEKSLDFQTPEWNEKNHLSLDERENVDVESNITNPQNTAVSSNKEEDLNVVKDYQQNIEDDEGSSSVTTKNYLYETTCETLKTITTQCNVVKEENLMLKNELKDLVKFCEETMVVSNSNHEIMVDTFTQFDGKDYIKGTVDVSTQYTEENVIIDSQQTFHPLTHLDPISLGPNLSNDYNASNINNLNIKNETVDGSDVSNSDVSKDYDLVENIFHSILLIDETTNTTNIDVSTISTQTIVDNYDEMDGCVCNKTCLLIDMSTQTMQTCPDLNTEDCVNNHMQNDKCAADNQFITYAVESNSSPLGINNSSRNTEITSPVKNILNYHSDGMVNSIDNVAQSDEVGYSTVTAKTLLTESNKFIKNITRKYVEPSVEIQQQKDCIQIEEKNGSRIERNNELKLELVFIALVIFLICLSGIIIPIWWHKVFIQSVICFVVSFGIYIRKQYLQQLECYNQQDYSIQEQLIQKGKDEQKGEFHELFLIIEKQEQVIEQQKVAINMQHHKLKKKDKKETIMSDIPSFDDLARDSDGSAQTLNLSPRINFDEIYTPRGKHLIPGTVLSKFLTHNIKENLSFALLSVFLTTLLVVYSYTSSVYVVAFNMLASCLYIFYNKKYHNITPTQTKKEAFLTAVIFSSILALFLPFTDDDLLYQSFMNSLLCASALMTFYVTNVNTKLIMLKEKQLKELQENKIKLENKMNNMKEKWEYTSQLWILKEKYDELNTVAVLKREDLDSIEILLNELDQERKEQKELREEKQNIHFDVLESLHLNKKLTNQVSIGIGEIKKIKDTNCNLRRELFQEQVNVIELKNKLKEVAKERNIQSSQNEFIDGNSFSEEKESYLIFPKRESVSKNYSNGSTSMLDNSDESSDELNNSFSSTRPRVGTDIMKLNDVDTYGTSDGDESDVDTIDSVDGDDLFRSAVEYQNIQQYQKVNENAEGVGFHNGDGLFRSAAEYQNILQYQKVIDGAEELQNNHQYHNVDAYKHTKKLGFDISESTETNECNKNHKVNDDLDENNDGNDIAIDGVESDNVFIKDVNVDSEYSETSLHDVSENSQSNFDATEYQKEHWVDSLKLHKVRLQSNSSQFKKSEATDQKLSSDQTRTLLRLSSKDSGQGSLEVSQNLNESTENGAEQIKQTILENNVLEKEFHDILTKVLKDQKIVCDEISDLTEYIEHDREEKMRLNQQLDELQTKMINIQQTKENNCIDKNESHQTNRLDDGENAKQDEYFISEVSESLQITEEEKEHMKLEEEFESTLLKVLEDQKTVRNEVLDLTNHYEHDQLMLSYQVDELRDLVQYSCRDGFDNTENVIDDDGNGCHRNDYDDITSSFVDTNTIQSNIKSSKLNSLIHSKTLDGVFDNNEKFSSASYCHEDESVTVNNILNGEIQMDSAENVPFSAESISIPPLEGQQIFDTKSAETKTIINTKNEIFINSEDIHNKTKMYEKALEDKIAFNEQAKKIREKVNQITISPISHVRSENFNKHQINNCNTCDHYAILVLCYRENVADLEHRVANEKRKQNQLIDEYEKELEILEGVLIKKFQQIKLFVKEIEQCFQNQNFEQFQEIKMKVKETVKPNGK